MSSRAKRDLATAIIQSMDTREFQLHEAAPADDLDTIHGAMARAHSLWRFCPFCAHPLPRKS